MLLRIDVLREIVAGTIDTQYRLWRKPTVKAGGRLRTQVGELTILTVEEIDPASVTDDDARRAGFANADEVRATFVPRPVKAGRAAAGAGAAAASASAVAAVAAKGRARTAKPDETSRPYRVTLRYEGVDTRLALREDTSAEAIAAVIAKLDAIDGRSARGPWTRRTLALIDEWPGRRAPELAEMEGLETMPFKNDVRKLKELGLTISLAVGYELSPRGRAVLGGS